MTDVIFYIGESVRAIVNVTDIGDPSRSTQSHVYSVWIGMYAGIVDGQPQIIRYGVTHVTLTPNSSAPVNVDIILGPNPPGFMPAEEGASYGLLVNVQEVANDDVTTGNPCPPLCEGSEECVQGYCQPYDQRYSDEIPGGSSMIPYLVIVSGTRP